MRENLDDVQANRDLNTYNFLGGNLRYTQVTPPSV